MKKDNKTYKAEILEANDGTGDAILQFPDELIAETGWKEDRKSTRLNSSH